MRVQRRWGVLIGFAATALAVVWSPCGLAAADDGPQTAHFEIWTGAQADRLAWAAYSGLTAAPFTTLDRDGLRLRFSGGYGSYEDATGVTRRRAATAFGDALVGYHSQFGPLTLKVFAGLTAAERDTSPPDPDDRLQGLGIGGKVAVETWWNVTEQAWTSLDLSVASLHDTYSGRARVGWRLAPALSLGLEAGAAGNIDGDILRAAAFLRYEHATGELSLSAGMSMDDLFEDAPGKRDAAATPYATVNWLQRF